MIASSVAITIIGAAKRRRPRLPRGGGRRASSSRRRAAGGGAVRGGGAAGRGSVGRTAATATVPFSASCWRGGGRAGGGRLAGRPRVVADRDGGLFGRAAAPPPATATSSRRNRTTVMLSRPPASLAAAISARPASARVAELVSSGRRSGSRTMEVRPSEHSRNRSPPRAVDALRVDGDVGLRPERAGDHAALRVDLGLLLGELAAVDELADERVVAGEAGELAVAHQVAARVADMGDDHLVLGDVGGGARRPHALPRRVDARHLVDALVASRMVATRPSSGRAPCRPAWKASTASSEATSPAWAPPMPSATTNSGARTK